jgi:hypothetical protein
MCPHRFCQAWPLSSTDAAIRPHLRRPGSPLQKPASLHSDRREASDHGRTVVVDVIVAVAFHCPTDHHANPGPIARNHRLCEPSEGAAVGLWTVIAVIGYYRIRNRRGVTGVNHSKGIVVRRDAAERCFNVAAGGRNYIDAGLPNRRHAERRRSYRTGLTVFRWLRSRAPHGVAELNRLTLRCPQSTDLIHWWLWHHRCRIGNGGRRC